MSRYSRVVVGFGLSGSLLGLGLMPGGARATSAVAAGSCSWSIVSSPRLDGSSILYGVDAVAADDVWAVGSVGAVVGPGSLAEHWDGHAWSVVPTPDPTRHSDDGNVLDAVSATGPADVWAVGSHIKRGGINTSPFIVHFDGTAWRRVPAPPGRYLDASLTGVAAVAPDDAWIVGFRSVSLHEAPLAMHWNGEEWSLVKVPNPPGDRDDELLGVSAVSSDDVWAVGEAGERDTMTLHYDGSRWARVDSPNPPGEARNSLTGVVAVSANDVWATGTGGSPNTGISLHWDGTSWRLLSMPRPGEFVELAATAAQPDGTIWSVGLRRPQHPKYQTLAERYDGSSWQVTKTPSLDKGDQLEGVAATDEGVWAVGVTAPGPDFQPGSTLILHRC